MLMVKNIALILLILFLLPSCSKKEKLSAELSYIKAMKYLKKKDYTSAAENFEKIDDEFPFSKWAMKAKTMAVYARYKDEEYAQILTLVDDFLRLNPNSEYVPYMIYMKGLSYYNRVPSIERAQDDTQKASFTFRELIARFPNDFHSSDAEKKLHFVDEHLAGSKMSIGRYHIENSNYIGAITNFKDVIDYYRQTDQVPEAYFRLTEIYCKIGLKQKGASVFVILRDKFPENYWTKLAQEVVTRF